MFSRILPKIQVRIALYHLKMNDIEFAFIVDSSSHLSKINFFACSLNLGELRFRKNIKFKIDEITFQWAKSDDKYNWGENFEYLHSLLEAIRTSSLRESMKVLGI